MTRLFDTMESPVPEIDLEIDFLHGPGVLDRRPIHLIKARVAHRPQGEIEARIEQRSAHWQASHSSGFSSEHTTAAESLTVACTVVLVILVAGRERK
jgi:hypothetical protein